jgi:hypothetical protein
LLAAPRNSSPAILLRESYRVDGKVKKRTLLNLSDWPTELIEGLRTLLKGGTALPPGQVAIIIKRSLPHGHVAAVLGTLRRIGLDRLLGPTGEAPNRCRDLVVAMIVARLIAKHFTLTITDTDFSFARRQDAIDAEARLDGVYMIRTNLKAPTLDDSATGL